MNRLGRIGAAVVAMVVMGWAALVLAQPGHADATRAPSGADLPLCLGSPQGTPTLGSEPVGRRHHLKLTASDAARSDYFGAAVAVSGETTVVGAYCDDTEGSGLGSAYVFAPLGPGRIEQAHLTASDSASYFGDAVAIDGDTAVVGAYGNDNSTGAAYVFVRSGTTWTQQAKLTASDATVLDEFGWSVAVSGDVAIVGAPGVNRPLGINFGAAYVFVRSGTTWTEQAHLTASDGASGDFLGTSVAVSGDTAVVGAYNDDTSSGTDAGSAYVFVRSGTTWTEQAHLTASDGAGHDEFGVSVAGSADTAVLGARYRDTPGGDGAGSAYVFVRSGTTWTQQAEVTASDATSYDEFGTSVAVSGNAVVVGAPNKADYTGAAYVFRRTGTTWSERGKLTAWDGAEDDQFGISVGVSGGVAVVGAFGDETPAGSRAGSAYAFRR
jgi:hypothetical protein